MDVEFKATRLGSLVAKTTEVNGENENLCQTFRHTGVLMRQFTFKKGLANGIDKSWYENSQLQTLFMLIDDKLKGMYISWHPNGIMKHKGMYIDNIPVGVHIYWNEQGEITEEINHDNRVDED